jgi:hypothetical protein
MQLLIVGCAYGEGLLDETVLFVRAHGMGGCFAGLVMVVALLVKGGRGSGR